MTCAQIELVDRFEGLELDATAFRHHDHIATAYAMLQKYPFLEATARYANTIRTMAANAGATTKFNMTITMTYMALIAERMESSTHRDFDEFSQHNPDLFSRDLLKQFYSAERLQSDSARRIFLMPDAGCE